MILDLFKLFLRENQVLNDSNFFGCHALLLFEIGLDIAIRVEWANFKLCFVNRLGSVGCLEVLNRYSWDFGDVAFVN
jgi:hypothetical protein